MTEQLPPPEQDGEPDEVDESTRISSIVIPYAEETTPVTERPVGAMLPLWLAVAAGDPSIAESTAVINVGLAD